MNLNVGQVIERVVRKDHMGISELSRKLHVSRRTIYNWFDQESLSLDVVCRIGRAIKHDFSKEFPEEFASKTSTNVIDGPDLEDNSGSQSVGYWMNKYIKLLEKYNELLSHEVSHHDHTGGILHHLNEVNGSTHNLSI